MNEQPMNDPSLVRIGNDERQRAYDLLSQHHSAGRIELHEYDERYQLIAKATTQPELDAVFADLPAIVNSGGARKRATLIALAVACTVLVAGGIGFAVFRSTPESDSPAAISTVQPIPDGLPTTTATATPVRSTVPSTISTTSTATSAPISSALNADSYVQDLEKLSGGEYHRYDEGRADVSNQVFTRSIMIMPNWKDLAFVEYDLGRKYVHLDGVLGIRNDATPSGVSMKFTILVDDVPVFDAVIALGDAVPIKLSVEKALRLKLEVTNLKVGGDAYAVFGDLRATTT